MTDSSPFKHETPNDSPGFLLWKITLLWQQKLAKVLEPFGITQTQFAILASLRWFEEQGKETTQIHIAEHAKIDRMTLSKAIRKLETAGLVIRRSSLSDSRAINVRFTDAGNSLIYQAVQAIEQADDDFFACLDEQQLAVYKTLTLLVISHA